MTKPGDTGGDLLAPLLPAGEPVGQVLRKAQDFVPGGTPSQPTPPSPVPAAGAGARSASPTRHLVQVVALILLRWITVPMTPAPWARPTGS